MWRVFTIFLKIFSSGKMLMINMCKLLLIFSLWVLLFTHSIISISFGPHHHNDHHHYQLPYQIRSLFFVRENIFQPSTLSTLECYCQVHSKKDLWSEERLWLSIKSSASEDWSWNLLFWSLLDWLSVVCRKLRDVKAFQVYKFPHPSFSTIPKVVEKQKNIKFNFSWVRLWEAWGSWVCCMLSLTIC